MSILGKRLKDLREKNNFSQKRVADSLGISNTQLSRYESGDRKPEPDLISQFADFYGVTTDYLHGRTNDPNGTVSKTKIIQHDDAYDSLAEINNLIKEYGIEDMGFFDIEKWKNLSPEDVEKIRSYFEFIAEEAKKRNIKDK